jgi:hypothetical protein
MSAVRTAEEGGSTRGKKEWLLSTAERSAPVRSSLEILRLPGRRLVQVHSGRVDRRGRPDASASRNPEVMIRCSALPADPASAVGSAWLGSAGHHRHTGLLVILRPLTMGGVDPFT